MKIAGVEFYDQSQKIIVTADASSNFTHIFSNAEYMYSELESYEYIENNGVIAKGGGVGRALIGGFLFGGTGAIVGAITKKPKQKNVIENMDVRMTFRVNGVIKTERVELNQSGVLKYGTMSYERCLNKAKQLIDKLDQISQQKQQSESVSAAPNPIISHPVTPAVDVKTKLLELKDLYEQCLIDEEEYKAAKKDVLAGNDNIFGGDVKADFPVLPDVGNETGEENSVPEKECKPRLSDSELVELGNYIKENFGQETKFKAINYYRKQAGVRVAEASSIVERLLKEKENDVSSQASGDIVQDVAVMPDAPEIKKDINTDLGEIQSRTSNGLQKESVKEEFVLCPSCKKQLNKGIKFCVFCGTKIEEKIPCPNCSKLVSVSAKFCNYCGESIK